ncbi:MAG TPA: hypothetical protein VFO85_15680 [Vicinamibacteria bacterium]|nr:hypothetical protein [Vicinamibacteria bacterium]
MASRARALRQALFVWVSLAYPATGWTDCKPAVSETAAGEVAIDWCSPTSSTGLRLKARIDDRMTVAITSQHFNFLHYGLDYAVEDKVVEAYVTMEKLWGQVFRVIGLLEGMPLAEVQRTRGAPGPCASFHACIVDWLWVMHGANSVVDRKLGAYARSGPGLPEADVTEIHRFATEDVPRQRTAVGTAREKVEAFTPNSVQDIDLFAKADAEHAKVLDKLDAFVVAARLVKEGQRKVIAKRKAGTLVTVSVTPKSRLEQAAGGTALTVDYFVHSRFPVTYHMGYAYSRLQDVELEKVRALGDRDFFTAVKDQDDVTAFTAFLSYPLKTWPVAEARYGAYLTLGTDLQHPGDRLYGAISARFMGRIMLDAGMASATVEKGTSKVIERLGDELGTRQLFDAVTTRRQWRPFVGLSVAVF